MPGTTEHGTRSPDTRSLPTAADLQDLKRELRSRFLASDPVVVPIDWETVQELNRENSKALLKTRVPVRERSGVQLALEEKISFLIFVLAALLSIYIASPNQVSPNAAVLLVVSIAVVLGVVWNWKDTH